MSRKLTAVLMIFCLVLVPLTGIAMGNAQSDMSPKTTYIFRLIDKDATPITGAYCLAYAYDDEGNMIDLGQLTSAADGTVSVSADIKAVSRRINNTYVHLAIKAFTPGKLPLSLHWSVDPDDASADEAMVKANDVNDVIMEADESMILSKGDVNRGTGIFRTRLISSHFENQLVRVGELHFVAGLKAKFEYQSTTTATITGAINFTGSWVPNANVQVNCSATNGGIKESYGMPGSQYMMAPHRFNREYWVLEEMDGDLYDVWNPVSSWIEMVPLLYLGGMNGGASVGGDGVTPTGDQVIVNYGETKYCWMDNTKSYSAGWSIGGADIGVSISYKKASKVTHWNDSTPGVSFTVFSPYGEGNKNVWYATRN